MNKSLPNQQPNEVLDLDCVVKDYRKVNTTQKLSFSLSDTRSSNAKKIYYINQGITSSKQFSLSDKPFELLSILWQNRFLFCIICKKKRYQLNFCASDCSTDSSIYPFFKREEISQKDQCWCKKIVQSVHMTLLKSSLPFDQVWPGIHTTCYYLSTPKYKWNRKDLSIFSTPFSQLCKTISNFNLSKGKVKKHFKP